MTTDAETRAPERTGDGAAEKPLQRLGKYLIEKKLGQGGMGAVYLARDSELRRQVAIKVLPKDKASNPTLVRRFKAEAQAAAQLRHDNIVAVYDSDEADGYLFIAMEYVDGQDLHEMINRRGKIPVKRSIEMIKQVVAALQHAHEHKIVHRDIKPSNLLIRRDGMVKITDLGLARSVDDTIETGITRAGTTVGTVDYMAPEQARNSKLADIRSDLYSLGCTWFQMLTGHAPYPEGSLTNKLQAHAVKPIPDPRAENDNVTEGLVAVIQRMMAKKPEDRYQTPAELLKDLEASSLTRAAFSQEIFNAIGDESGHAIAARVATADEDAGSPAPAKRKKRSKRDPEEVIEEAAGEIPEPTSAGKSPRAKKEGGSLPPPTRRRPVEEDGEQPASPWGERLKTLGIIGGVVAGIGLLAGLASNIGGVFDSSPNHVVVKPVDPNAGTVVPDPGQATVAAVSGTVGGPTVNTATPVAPVFSTGGQGSLTPRTGMTAASNSTTGGTAAGGQTGGMGQTTARAKTPITAANLGTIRPADPQQRPDWSKAPARPAAAAGFSVGPGAVSATHFASLNDALLKLPPTGGVIRLVGNGPFPLSLTVPVKTKQLLILGDPQAFSLVVPIRSADGQLGRIDIDGELELSDVHIACDTATQTPAAPMSLLQVRSGHLTLTRSSLTLMGGAGSPVAGVTLAGEKTPQRLVCRRTLIRGEFVSGIDLRTSAVDVVIDESLVAAGRGAALRFEGRSGLTPVGQTCRWVRCFASTLCSREQLVDFSAESGLSEHPKTELVFRDVIGCTAAAPGKNILLNVTDWLQQGVRDEITWTTSDSTFLGFPHLVDFGAKSTFRVDDADNWRQFWRQKVAPQEFVTAVWPSEIADFGSVSPLAFDRNLLPTAARQAGASGELPGVAPEWLRLPEAVEPERLAALAGRSTVPVIRGWINPPNPAEPVRIDIKKQDLGLALAKNDWPDGAVIEAVGFGVCPMSPVVITGKKLKLIFRQENDKGPLRVTPREGLRPVEALFDVRDGALELHGMRAEFPELRPKHPSWLISAKNSALVLEGCEIRAPETILEPYQGLVKFSTPAAKLDSAAFASIANSLLIGPGTLVRTEGGGGRLFAHDSIFVTDDGAISVYLAPRGTEIPFSLDIVSSTFATAGAAFRVEPASLTEACSNPSRWFVEHCAFVPPTSLKAPPGTEPMVMRCAGPVLDQKQINWWGRGNGLAKELRTLVAAGNAAAPRKIATAEEWRELWGAGHDLKLLTGPDGVVMLVPYPPKSDQWAPASFALHPSSKSAVWADGTPIGADIPQLKNIGPAVIEVAPPPGKKTTPKVPNNAKPQVPQKPGF